MHHGHNPNCHICLALPLTEEDKAYYRGWDDYAETMRRNGWYPVENCVLDAYEELETAARYPQAPFGMDTQAAMKKALASIDKMRELKRGFAPPREERYKEDEK
jgi:hypothetical protein